MYSINFTVKRKKFCLSLHYNGVNSYLFVNGTPTPLCLRNISKDWFVDTMKKTGFTGYVYDFSVMMLLQLTILKTFTNI